MQLTGTSSVMRSSFFRSCPRLGRAPVRAQDGRPGRMLGNIKTSRQRIQSIIETAERGQYDRYDDRRPGMDRRSAPPPPRAPASYEDDRRTWSNEFYTASEAIRQEQERYGGEYGGRYDDRRYDDRRYDDRRYDDRRYDDRRYDDRRYDDRRYDDRRYDDRRGDDRSNTNWAASAASLLTNAANSLAEASRQATAERRAPPSWQQAPPRRYEERYQRSAPAYQGVQDDGSSFQWLVLLGSLVAIPTVVASEISIASTGPFGLLGGLEAVSYLTVLTVLGWSAYRRLVRGAPGLPPGPLGLLPVAEGLSYAAAIGFLFVISVQILGNGWVPGALAPQSPCF